MREPSARRDQREIVVPGDMRAGAGPARAPRRAAPQARPARGAGRASAVAGTLARLCLRHPGGVAGTLAGLGAAVYVCLNAVGFQVGRHPAPILPTVEQKPVAARPAPVREVRAVEAPKPGPAPRDPIAEMIRSGETTASVTPKADPKAASRPAARAEVAKTDAAKTDAAKAEPAKPDPNVQRAQRALAKLGYGPIKDDGRMGPGTKAALEKFERDRKLPVKGEAAGRTLRELTAKAGPPQG